MAAPKTPQFSGVKFSPLSDTKKETFENKTIQTWLSDTATTEMQNRFGLKSSDDVLTLLRSPNGKFARELINRQMEAMKAMEARKNNTKQSQLFKKRLTALILGLAYQKEAAAETREARIVRLNDKLVDKQLDAGEKRIEEQEEKALQDSIESSREAEADYHDSIEALEAALDEQNDMLDSIEDEWAEIKQLDLEQEARGGLIDSLLDNIDDVFDLDSEEHDKLTLDDRDLINKFPKDKTIVKEKGKSYVLERGQKLDQLSSEEKQKAHQGYLKLKPSLNALQERLKASHQTGKNQHADKKEHVLDKSAQAHQDIIFLTQQITDLQTERHIAQNQLKPTAHKQLDTTTQQQPNPAKQNQEQKQKQPNPEQQNLQAPTVAQPAADISVFKRSFEQRLRLDPRGTLAAQDRLGAPDFVKQVNIGFTTNTELETHKSLQRHRVGKAGALANDLLTNPQSLAAQRNDDKLTPEPNSPRAQARASFKAELQAVSKPAAKAEPKDEIEAEPKPTTPSPFSTTPKPQ